MAERQFKFSLPERILFASFPWLVLVAIVIFVPFLRVWWWMLVPLILYFELHKVYLWWVRWDFNYTEKTWVVLEIVPPKEVLVPLKAMEDVFSVLWPVLYAPPNWREFWFEGVIPNGTEWMSFEIASFEGNIHFYMRATTSHASLIQSILYAHYPELEIREVLDYTNNVPKGIPNAEWDTYGEDFIFTRDPAYPIKTYEKFFEPQGERISAEEKRIDPIGSLLENLGKIGPGEQFWLQFIISSVDTKEDAPEFLQGAHKIIAKVSKRPEKKHESLIDHIMTALFHIIRGPIREGTGENASYYWLESAKTESGERELLVTPGEREIITEVENKIKKPIFRAVVRGLYAAKRENWKSGNKTLTRAYFAHFGTQHLNSIRFSPKTRPKTQYLFRKRIPLMRAKRQLRNYINRFTPFFPDRKRECMYLNPEEMATIFHFPLKVSGLAMPTMARVESKKSGPPPNLPVE